MAGNLSNKGRAKSMQKRDVLSSPRLKELKRRRRRAVWGKVLILFFGFSAVFGSFAYLSQLARLNINTIEVTGNKIVDNESIISIVKENTAGEYLWFLPKTNILYYPQNDIESALRVKFKRLKEIDLSIKSNQTLAVTVTEYEPSYTWCGLVAPGLNSNIDQKCYFMDSEGYIFDEAPYFSGGVYFKFYGLDENINIENPVGVYFLKDKFVEILKFKTRIEELGMKPTALSVNREGDTSFFLYSKSAAAPEIIFKIDSDLDIVAENLQTALSTEPLKSKFKNYYSSLQYIDLRFGNKVYNKFR